MTWDESKAVAAEILKNLRSRGFTDADLRLVIRALGRAFQTHKQKTTMNQPQIIVAEVRDNLFKIDVSGRFGGGFRGVTKDRNGVIAMLGHLKTYDCGEVPAAVICPESLRPEFEKVFPESF